MSPGVKIRSERLIGTIGQREKAVSIPLTHISKESVILWKALWKSLLLKSDKAAEMQLVHLQQFDQCYGRRSGRTHNAARYATSGWLDVYPQPVAFHA